MDKSNKKPTVLLMLEGFGLSTSWQRNAVASANLTQFNRLWRNFDHCIIHSPLKKNSLDKKTFYEAFFHNNALTTQETIQTALDQKKADSEKFALPIAHVKKYNSKVHHILTVSEKDYFSTIDNLISLVKILRDRDIHQQEIHLFIVENNLTPSVLEKIDHLNNKLVDITGAEIATITYLQQLYSNDMSLQKVISSLLLGQGKRIVSLKQIGSSRSQLTNGSHILTSNKNFIISDFDCIVFADFDYRAIAPLSRHFMTLADQPGNIKLKYLLVEHLIKDGNVTVKNSLVDSSKESEWLGELSKKIEKGLFIADDIVIDNISSIITPPPNIDAMRVESDDFSNPDKIFRVLKDAIKSKDYDFIFVDIPYIMRVCERGKFGEVVAILKKIDNLLADIESSILESDGKLILSSIFGAAEKITSHTFAFGQIAECTTSSLPLLNISNKTKKAHQPPFGIIDLMKTPKKFDYIYKLIIEDKSEK
jgi:2,3-bisphosphoglycerate-independent phosphoglycerate mutase